MSSSGRWQKLFFFVFFSVFGFESFLGSFLLLLSSDAIDEVDADVEAEAVPDDDVEDKLNAEAANDDAVEEDVVVDVEDDGKGADAPEVELFAEAVMNSPISPASLTISSCVRSFSSRSGSENNLQSVSQIYTTKARQLFLSLF
jgi:hypothetical protein